MASEFVVRFGDFELDSQRCELRRDGVVVSIHPRPFRALSYLLWAGLHDFPAAARELEIVRKLKSDSVWPSFDRSLLSAELGRLSEAREQIDRALEIDPLSPLVTQVAGEIYYLSGEYDAAIELLERAEGAGHGVAPLLLFTYIALGRADELFQLSLSALPPDAPDAVREGLVRAFDQGGIPGLLRYRIELERTTSDRSCGDNPFLTAAFLAVLEEKEQVFACLAEAERRNTLTWVKSEPLFAQYRDDPRFVAMLGRLGVL